MDKKKIDSYRHGDVVEVLVNDPSKLDNDYREWREGKVIGVQTIFPSHGSKHKPYPMVTVEFTRTYCKATPKYKYLEGTAKRVKVFIENDLNFYDKKSLEGFSRETQIRPKL